MGLLRSTDSQPVIAERSGSDAPFLFICDHAGRDIPAALGRLGLPESALDLHIAWDIGAGDVTRRLGRALTAPSTLPASSGPVFDCNRAPPSLGPIPAVSDGVAIPANQDLA